ncbi:Hypothetical protein A7982_08727 [Minicystis rosea]|nr:Hypothetical protein A7982_08727 [Minicystis rosea]
MYQAILGVSRRGLAKSAANVEPVRRASGRGAARASAAHGWSRRRPVTMEWHDVASA